ncbi:Rrf2 family transcriptional regulator [Amylibacter cionae]|uniref:Rrf2 family transcriptional regulator n=2 Tax=Neptunicoccus cionae TaxID=2035344 RepID=A0A916QP22_9RHOB|nr:Rrf2 family transcriptional regulator [Amylibacter cionae]
MQMTKFTDYGLRVLMALAVTQERALGGGQIAAQYGISQHHVAKIATALVAGGFVLSERGRGGGLRLARPAKDIRLGAVVRHLSKSDVLVECMGQGSSCCILPACGLRSPLQEAQEAFFTVLDGYTVADTVAQGDSLRKLLAV